MISKIPFRKMLLLCVMVMNLPYNRMLYAEELWLAVGYGGRRMISTDGLKWEITAEWAQPGADDSNNLMSAVYAEGKFVVVGGGGGGNSSAGHILVSTNGRSWNEVHKDKSRVNPVVYGDGRFVAGTSNYPSGTLMWSEDGEKWNKGAKIKSPKFTHFRGGVFGNGVFVMTGNHVGSGGPHWVIVSKDGETISHESDSLPGHGTMVFGGGHFVMKTDNNKADLIASTDGVTWEQLKLPEDLKVNWLVWSGKELLAGDGKVTISSVDAKVWKKVEIKTQSNIKWSDGKRFISSSWPGKMAFSADGIKWENSPALTANGINVVIKKQD